MVKRWLGPLAEVRREELPFALLMGSYFFLVITSFWILKPLKKSVFIEFYDRAGIQWGATALDAAQTELLAKVLNMAVAAGAVACFSLLARRLRREKLALTFTAVFVVGEIAFSIALARPGALSVWSFYFFGDLFSTLMVATFFAFLNDSVSPDAAKRLYGPIGLGGVLGGVVGTSVLSVWIRALGVSRWLWICAGLGAAIGAAAVAAARMAEHLRPEARAARRAAATDAERRGLAVAALGARLVARSRYLLAIASLVALYEIASTILDFQFTSTVAHQLDGDAIGQQFALVFAITNAVSVAVQLGVTSPVLTALGVGPALLFLPTAILVGSSAFLLHPSLWTGSLLNTADNGFSYSINQSAKEALYVPAREEEKYHAKAFIDMFVQRFAKALGVGLSLIATTWFAELAMVRWLSFGTLALLALWVPVVLHVGRRFRSLANGEVEDARAPQADRTTLISPLRSR
jgi:AAA family ATP:ADP antiporter